MKSSRFFLCLVLASVPAAATDLTGFPFQNETLRYNIKWPSAISMGEATVSAARADSEWRFEMTFSASVPGFSFADTYRSKATSEFCATELERNLQHGTKKVTEKTTFDQGKRTAERRTTFPAGGGVSQLDLPACAQDALTYWFVGRREMGQGRVPQASKVYLGGAYDVRMQYTGAMDIQVGNKTETTDHVNVFIKGPASEITVEVYYARDAARTPLLITVPVSLGKIALELVRR